MGAALDLDKGVFIDECEELDISMHAPAVQAEMRPALRALRAEALLAYSA